MKFSGKVGNGPVNNRLNFDGDPDHRLNTVIVFRIRHYWQIQKLYQPTALRDPAMVSMH